MKIYCLHGGGFLTYDNYRVFQEEEPIEPPKTIIKYSYLNGNYLLTAVTFLYTNEMQTDKLQIGINIEILAKLSIINN